MGMIHAGRADAREQLRGVHQRIADHHELLVAITRREQIRDLVAQDKAGERVMEECMRRRNHKLPPGQTCRLYKN